VRYHYVKHVEEPLQRYGFKVDRYLSVVKPFAPLSVISATYNATALREVPEEKFYKSCNSKTHIVDRQELLQYVSVRDCYEQIEAVESAANARYTWIYRMRTDMVHLADIPASWSIATIRLRVSRRHVKRSWVAVHERSHFPLSTPPVQAVFFCHRALGQSVLLWVKSAEARPFARRVGWSSVGAVCFAEEA